MRRSLWARLLEFLCAHDTEIRWRDDHGTVYRCENCFRERRIEPAVPRYVLKTDPTYDEAKAVKGYELSRTHTPTGRPLPQVISAVECEIPTQAELLMDEAGPSDLVH